MFAMPVLRVSGYALTNLSVADRPRKFLFSSRSPDPHEFCHSDTRPQRSRRAGPERSRRESAVHCLRNRSKWTLHREGPASQSAKKSDHAEVLKTADDSYQGAPSGAPKER